MCEFYSSRISYCGGAWDQQEIMWSLFPFHPAPSPVWFPPGPGPSRRSWRAPLSGQAHRTQTAACGELSPSQPKGNELFVLWMVMWVSSRCLRIEACDEVCVILVQSDGGAEVRLRLLRLGLGHAQLKLSPLLGAEIMTLSVISIGVSCEQSSCSAWMRY